MSRAIRTNTRRQLTGQTLVGCALAVAVMSGPAAAHEDEVLGKVHFANSCSAGVQESFDRAVALQHSFWYQAAYKTFDEVLAADPTCAIAHWGKAMTLLFNPFNQPPAKNLADGAAEIAAGHNPAAKTARERDFIDAVGAFYTDADKLDHRTRVAAYLKAMEALATKYSDDSEARIFYALALDEAVDLKDKTYSRQLKAGAMLEQWNSRHRKAAAQTGQRRATFREISV